MPQLGYGGQNTTVGIRSPLPCGSRNRAQIIRLGSKHLSPTEPSCQTYSNYLAAHGTLVFSFLFFYISGMNATVRDACKTTPETLEEGGQGGVYLSI